MKRIGWIIILLLIHCSVAFGGPGKGLSRNELEQVTLKKLQTIEQSIKSNPEEAIKKLDGIIRYTINQNLNQSMSFAYLLMGRAYKELRQPEIALHFIQLAEENYLKPSKRLKDVKDGYYKVDVKSGWADKESISADGLGNSNGIPLIGRPIDHYLDLAEIYVQLGNYQLANKNFELYKIEQNEAPEIRRIDYLIAQNLYAMEEFKKAISVYEKLLSIEKEVGNEVNESLCYSRLAACYISLGETEKGLTFYKLSTQGLSEEQKVLNYRDNSIIISKALRKQNKFAEEATIRNEALSVVNDGLEHLRLAQTYHQAGDLNKAETSLDNYFQSISYDLLDKSEITVIKEVALYLKGRKNEKALQYILHYEALSDTIENRLMVLTSRAQQIGALGGQNVLQLEILRKDKQMSENTINHLMREGELKEDIVGFQKTMIYLLCGVILLGVVALIYIIRVSGQRRVANQQLALRSLRSQMNPHFIFNALNSVNSFISMSDERSANRFLSEFSTLMRTVMENSEHDFISLTKELEIVKIYMELEHFRFQDKFSFQLTIDEEIDEEVYVLPPMLIQPYIENAIWHGLRYKESKGELKVSFGEEQGQLKVVIQDNGIGRKKSQEIKTKNQKKNKSTALKNIGERVQLFNSLHRVKVEVTIRDLEADGSGTVVSILIPQPKHG